MSECVERPITFKCAEARLVGIVHQARMSAADIGVLVVVGGPQYRAGSHRQFVLMARDLASAGYTVFRFDYRGMGDSEGNARGFESVDADLRAAIDAFIAAVPQLRGVVLWGLCDAASACFMYAPSDPRVMGIVVANPWVHTEAGAATAYIKHYYGRRLLQRSFWAKVLKGDFDVVASLRDFLKKLGRSIGPKTAPPLSFIERMKDGLQRFHKPVLLLMSENDLTAQEFRELCARNVEWARLVRRPSTCTVDLRGADHTFSSRSALRTATTHCLEWLREHAPAPAAASRERRA